MEIIGVPGALFGLLIHGMANGHPTKKLAEAGSLASRCRIGMVGGRAQLAAGFTESLVHFLKEVHR